MTILLYFDQKGGTFSLHRRYGSMFFLLPLMLRPLSRDIGKAKIWYKPKTNTT